MDEPSRGPSRRGFLKRGVVLAAGALGVGAAGRVSGASAAVPSQQTLTLHGRFFHLHAQDRRAGVVPVKGERLTGYGELLDRPGGTKVGEFFSTLFALDSPFGPTPMGATGLEYHSFNLHDGTILGLGTGAGHGESVFAIVGGTGRYAGARGTYVAHQRQRELGGNGMAEFRLTLGGLEGVKHGI
jgi:hypothetical protein